MGRKEVLWNFTAANQVNWLWEDEQYSSIAFTLVHEQYRCLLFHA